jgi:hypothetical protein
MKKTLTTIFFVPTLKIPKIDLINNEFINAYINDEQSKNEHNDCIYLLFRPFYISRFIKFVNKEYAIENSLIENYDLKNGFVVLVYKLNGSFLKDFELIKQGKYSKTSKNFQKQFSETVEIERDNKKVEEKSLQYRIFNKTKDLEAYWKTQFLEKNNGDEVWFEFNRENEILNETEIKNIFFSRPLIL